MEKEPDDMTTDEPRPEMLGAVRSWELWPILVIFIAYGYWRWT